MKTPVGALTAADEQFIHQTTETFANVATSDPAWTERAYGCAIAKDGGFALHWGVGKYVNRNVLDGFAGLAIGRRQRNVRFSRKLAPQPADIAAGPFRYEIIEPFKSARIVLEPTEHQPIAFDIIQHAVQPAWLEERSYVQNGFRRAQDELRYVIPASASGWVEFEGERHDIKHGASFGFRDHSWGIKQNTGSEAADRARMPGGIQYRMIWCPSVLEREDGTAYRVHLFFWEARSPRGGRHVNESQIFQPDGSALHASETIANLAYDPANREPLGGDITLAMPDGSKRPFLIEVAAESRTCLGAGLYHGYKGHYHGEDRGMLHVEGECLDDTSDPAVCRSLHQLRDILVRIEDPVGGGKGWGILNSEIVGAWPELGLADENWR